jgi:hypothetical protein
LVVNRDRDALAEDQADGLLVLEHHNAGGDRAHVVRVRADRNVTGVQASAN